MKLFFINIFLFLSFFVLAQESKKDEDVVSYINQYKDIAIEEMIRTGVPASIKLAQGILESGSGKSQLSLMSNNHFGVKCKKNWTGEKVYFDDDLKGECFRKYANPKHSYKDQSNFLVKNQRYHFLFSLNVLDYKSWSKGLEKAGYATSPKYSKSLINLIEKYDLQQYTYEGLYKQKLISRRAYRKYTKKASINAPLNTKVLPNTRKTIPKTNMPLSKIDLTGKKKSIQQETINSMNFNDVGYINSTKAIKVKAGTSLIAIAIENNIDYGDLLKINNIDNNQEIISKKEMILYLKRKKAKSKRADYHLVDSSKMLVDISQIEGVNLESLQRLNPTISSDQVLEKNQVVWLR